MKLPRDLDGIELAKRLQRYGYDIVHQTGSHLILKTAQNGEHTVSVLNHKPLKVGTLNSFLNEVAEHIGLEKQVVIERLLSRR
ncbi:MAG: type II toxin-antitoxin system HicA family toxin [Cytophagales bacterium]|nr:MAG: type II toxin-antitoxin system HicA family toxin [Cytophagales bacterium]